MGAAVKLTAAAGSKALGEQVREPHGVRSSGRRALDGRSRGCSRGGEAADRGWRLDRQARIAEGDGVDSVEAMVGDDGLTLCTMRLRGVGHGPCPA